MPMTELIGFLYSAQACFSLVHCRSGAAHHQQKYLDSSPSTALRLQVIGTGRKLPSEGEYKEVYLSSFSPRHPRYKFSVRSIELTCFMAMQKGVKFIVAN